jgi:hypothetical protein
MLNGVWHDARRWQHKRSTDARETDMTSNDELVRIAALMVAADAEAEAMPGVEHEASGERRRPSGETVPPAEQAAFDAFDKLDKGDMMLVLFAKKILEGKPYQYVGSTADGNAAATIKRMRDLAEHIGATVTTVEEGKFMDTDAHVTKVVFQPTARQ